MERRVSPRNVVRRRRAAALVVVALLILALVLALWGCSRQDTPAGSTNAAGAATAVAGKTTLATAPSTTSTTAPPAPRKLKLVTHPAKAGFVVTGPEGTLAQGKTPWAGSIPGGKVQVAFTMSGRNDLTKDVDLTGNRTLQVWLDPKGALLHRLRTFFSGPCPKQVAFTPDNKELWVSLLGGGGLQVFDPATGRLLDTVKMGKDGAVEVIFTNDGKTAYASQMQTGTVWEIDRATHEVRRTMSTGGKWTKVMALSPDEKTLFAANWESNDVSEIDLTTSKGTVRRLLPSVTTPRGLWVTPDAKRLFVAGYDKGDLQVFDLATGKSRVILKTGGALRHLVGDPAKGKLYVDDMARDEVYVVDLATEKATLLAKTDEKPNTMDLSPDGKVLYISNRGENNPETYYEPGPEWGSVLAIDTASGKVLDAVVGGNQPTGLDVSPDGKTLAFSDFLDDRIQLLALPAYEVLANGGGGRAQAHLADIKKD
jgi:DNA-binding beta-propeller fold protein YncE